jgi:hypothetical protein
MSVVNLRRYSFATGLTKGGDFADIPYVAPSDIIISTTNLQLNTDAQNTTSNPGSGTTWFDLTANAYNGTLTNGAAFTAGTPKYVLLDGSNDYVTYGDILGAPAAITLQGWWYGTNINGAGINIMAAYWTDTGNQRSIIFGHNIDSGQGPGVLLDRSGTFSDVLKVQKGSQLSNNVWYHLAFTFNGQTAIIYQDGVQIATGAYGSNSALFNSSDPLYVGRDGQGRYWGGRVGEFDWYNAAISGATVLSNFNATKAAYGK